MHLTQLSLCCFSAVLIASSFCFPVTLILERWVSFSFLNSTVRSDVPSSLALKAKACLYLCHLNSVVTCCRSEEIFSWKSYLAKYRLPFVHASLGLCLHCTPCFMHFQALSTPQPPPSASHNFLTILVLEQKWTNSTLPGLALSIELEPGQNQIF